jgi:hypothetical protein
MRILRRFTVADLVTTAEAALGCTQNYVYALERVGIVRKTHRGHGRGGNRSIWTLTRDTGPHPPAVRRGGQVHDPNTDTMLDPIEPGAPA